MGDEHAYEPEEGDFIAHRHDGRPGDSFFTVGTGYGTGEPHFFVWLEEDGGERAWWLDPDQAVALGRRLVKEGLECVGIRPQDTESHDTATDDA